MIPETLYRISLPYATFGLVARSDRIKESAPIAQWAIGKTIKQVLDYYRSKGAEIERMDMAKINTTTGSMTGSTGLHATAASCVAIEDDLPRLGGALAEDALPSLFDEVAPRRPTRLVTVECAICRTIVRISFLADGKLCDVCRMDLPLCATNIAADLDRAEQTYTAALIAIERAADAATAADHERYNNALEVRRTGMQGGKRFTQAQIDTAWARLASGDSTLATLIQAHDARQVALVVLNETRAWARQARADLRAAGWQTKETRSCKTS